MAFTTPIPTRPTSWLSDDQIGFLDFGNVGYLTPGQKELLGDMFLQILDEDAGGVARTVVKMGATRGRPALEAMERDLQRLLIRYWGIALEELPVGEMLAEVFTTAYQHKVYLPGDLALLARTIITLEGTGRVLDPEFVLVDAVRPFAVRLVRDRLSPVAAGRRALRTLRQAADLAQAFPRRLDDLWDQLEEGEITFGVEVRRLEEIINKLNSMVNRVAFSVVVAALIIGSALILLGGKERWQFPLLGLRHTRGADRLPGGRAAGAWLLISMIRSRKDLTAPITPYSAFRNKMILNTPLRVPARHRNAHPFPGGSHHRLSGRCARRARSPW